MDWNTRKRIVFFAHFDLGNIIDDYVIYYLQEIRKYADYLVFVSTSPLPPAEVEKGKLFCDKLMIRENIGYDFFSWHVGMENVPDIDQYDELVICNDSAYGPLFPLREMFEKMSGAGCDFWGITDSHSFNYHLQSYFIVFGRMVFTSREFKSFFKNLIVGHCKDEIIIKCEVALTQTLLRSNFKAGVYMPSLNSLFRLICARGIQIKNRGIKRVVRDFKEKKPFTRSRWDVKQINKSHMFWEELVKRHRMPFLKAELIRENPGTINISNYQDVLKNYTRYDASLITRHSERIKRTLPASLLSIIFLQCIYPFVHYLADVS
ncbi:MAG: rhamnan synthesis F family protein [Desulfobacterales bacterium]